MDALSFAFKKTPGLLKTTLLLTLTAVVVAGIYVFGVMGGVFGLAVTASKEMPVFGIFFGMLMLLTILLCFLIMVGMGGFFVVTLNNFLRNIENPFPKVGGNIGLMLSRGIKLMGIFAIYLLPAIVVMIIGETMAEKTHQLSVIAAQLFALLWYIPVFVILPAILVKLAISGKFLDSLNLFKIIDFIKADAKKYFQTLAYLFLLFIGYISLYTAILVPIYIIMIVAGVCIGMFSASGVSALSLAIIVGGVVIVILVLLLCVLLTLLQIYYQIISLKVIAYYYRIGQNNVT